MRRQIIVRNPKLMDRTQDEIRLYFNLICPKFYDVEFLGFGRFEVFIYE